MREAVRMRVGVAAGVFAAFAVGALVSNGSTAGASTGAALAMAGFSGAIALLAFGCFVRLNATPLIHSPLTARASAAEGAVIGIAFGLAIIASSAWLGIVTTESPLVLLAGSALSTAILAVGLVALAQTRQEEDARRRRLLEEGIALHLARQETAEIVQRIHAELQADIEAALSSARTGLEERLAEQESVLETDRWPAIAQDLRTTAHDTVRPLSRRLWNQATESIPRAGLGQIFGNVLREQPFQPVALTLIYLATSFGSRIAALGWGFGLLSLAIGVALIVGVLGTANRLMARFPAWHVPLFIGGTLALQALGFAVLVVYRPISGSTETNAQFLASAVVGIILTILTSAYGSLRTSRADMERTFRADLDQELVGSIAAGRAVAQLARETARLLHGDVQTRLVACAIAIEQAARSQDSAAFLSALGQAQSALAHTAVVASDDDTTIASEVTRKVSLWAGLCDIDSEIDRAVQDLRGRAGRDVGRVVEEAVGNAIRHGDATRIHVAVRPCEGELLVAVVDNGRLAAGTAGLGSALLDSLCRSWSLESTDEGTRLTAYLPIR